jgi:hypothetical protein
MNLTREIYMMIGAQGEPRNGICTAMTVVAGLWLLVPMSTWAAGANQNEQLVQGTAAQGNTDKSLGCGGDTGGGAVLGPNVLQGFSTTFSSGATLATADILNAYVNQGIGDGKAACQPLNAFSVDVSATAEATSASFADYAKAQFLGRRNGLINIFVNPFAGRDATIPPLAWNTRDVASDHIYMRNPWTPISKADNLSKDQLLGFWLLGVGGRGVKTAQNGTNLEAVGTIYAGFGIDGPIHDSSVSNSADETAWGGISLQAFATANAANPGVLANLFYPANAARADVRATFETVGASMTLWMPAKLYFSLEYNRGVGATGSKIGETVSLSFGYGSANTVQTSKVAAAAAARAKATD